MGEIRDNFQEEERARVGHTIQRDEERERGRPVLTMRREEDAIKREEK